MNELKRFNICKNRMKLKPDGLWCRFADVEKILSFLTRKNERPMTNEEYAANLAKLQNDNASLKADAKLRTKEIKELKHTCVKYRNKINKLETVHAKELFELRKINRGKK